MTKEELKKHASNIIDMLDDLGPVEMLDVLGLVYTTETLDYILSTAGMLEGKERQQEMLIAIDKQIESMMKTIHVFFDISISRASASKAPKDKEDCHER